MCWSHLGAPREASGAFLEALGGHCEEFSLPKRVVVVFGMIFERFLDVNIK